jgi:DNA-binding LacI/PurR family transcriptional regulator
MKTPANLKPVARAIENFEQLVRIFAGKRGTPLPTEGELARKWCLGASAVNRAAHQLIGSGRLRREGYKLYAVNAVAANISGARISVITHRMDRMAGIVDEAAQRGVVVEENFMVGRDSFRHYLQKAIRERVDGVIFRQCDSGWEWDAEMAELDRLNIPCIVGEEAPQNVGIVAEDWRGATKMLVEHMLDMGHRSIVCVGSLRRKDRSDVVCEAFEAALLHHGLPDIAKQQILLASHTRQGIRSALRKCRARFPEATALVWFDVDHVRNLMLAMRDERLSIPRDMSLGLVGDTVEARANVPPITCAGFDLRTHANVALDAMYRQIADARHWGRILQRPRIRIEATLRRGGSVLNMGAPVDQTVSHPAVAANVWPRERGERIRAAEKTWLAPHTLARMADPADFAQLDLRVAANRSLHRPHGWLGHLPLKNLEPGTRRIHGVDFDLMDESANNGRAVLVMQSSRALPGARNPMPAKVVLSVGRRVRAVYFLHGCGFADEPVPFAWYDFANAAKHTFSVPLVPLGVADRRDVPAANIQDWWADFPQFDADRVKHLVLAGNGDPYEYERYLYTYEWVNPEPDAPLTSITVRSNPDEPTTLGLLAVTLLLAK